MTPTADVEDFIAALVLDPRHRCSPNCICDKVKEIPQISEAIRRLEYEIKSFDAQRERSRVAVLQSSS